MRKALLILDRAYARISVVRALTALVLVLLVSYVGLIAFVMSYGAMETETAQAVRDASAEVSALEMQSLAQSAKLSVVDPKSLGFVSPTGKNFVTGTARAAINVLGQ